MPAAGGATTIRLTAVVVLAAAGLVGLGVGLAPAPTRAADQPTGDAAAGRQVFEANCAMCHGSDARGMMDMHPSLRGTVQRLSRQGVVVTIREGRNTTPPMPGFDDRLTDTQIADVTAYLAELPTEPRNSGPRPGRDRTMGDDSMMDGGMMNGGWLTVLLTVLVAVLVLLVVAIIIVWLLRDNRDGRPPPGPRSAARAELDRRYAAGELTREDYLQRREDLEG